METRLSINAIKTENVIIYNENLEQHVLDDFINGTSSFLECSDTSKGNIYFENNNIILKEWNKYKVKSLDNSFIFSDFIKKGEFGSKDYGTLLFKNCVGITFFKKIKLLIESEKITSEEMDFLISTVNSFIINLSYDFNQSTFSEIERNKLKKTDLNYHTFLIIHNALNTKNSSNNIFSIFKLIENNPNRLMSNVIKYENIENVNEISNESLVDIFSGSTRLIPCNNNLNLKFKINENNYIPKELLIKETIDTFDNSENRFIKFFIEWCLQLITKFQKFFINQDNFSNYELIEENQEHIGKLKNILQRSFLKNIGVMNNIPSYSTVLTRKDGYRHIFHLYLGIKSLPKQLSDSTNIEEMIENKSLDVLYENYCFFAISQIIADIYEEKLNKKKYSILKSDFSKTLKKQTYSNYFEFKENKQLPRIRLHYNKNYTVESYSTSYDPDISLEIFNGSELAAIYIFDAKFKIQSISIENTNLTEKKIEKYKNTDIDKMHTYRDALVLAKGAFILYPGNINKLFYENANSDNDLLYGVGAFKLKPGNNNDLVSLKPIIKKLLIKYKY
ncbi:DUF2357 domain-containing protein (plasmid) [Thiospirochaeta perfilievii]|uniref:DUF2357 domain-containing protein n=1 Tax=Thiospirochaeta perfilievii TaxID=252967 RepID=A0A5C1QIQ0_9SPIO|nr:DUF2357 domain-containing protein [Thiospirochaeta perfilievii]QEN06424.1 DUF2357 domain-containing protein [Thiospirochaeta perfilievii]